MPYPINQRAHQFNLIQSVPVSFGLWDTALKFLSPGPRSDFTDHLDGVTLRRWSKRGFPLSRNFYVITRVHFTRVNEIEAMNGRSRVNVKVEHWSTLS